MKDKVKNFLKKNSGYILIGGISIAICIVSYKYGFKKGQRQVESMVDKALNIMADKTPEFTLGEFQKQVAEGIFDPAKYVN